MRRKNAPFVPIEGLQCGRWTLIKRVGTRAQSPLWLCECSCGTRREVIWRTLARGRSSSCGCLRVETLTKIRTTHGDTGSAEYSAWASAMNRCYYSTAIRDVVNYQQRGIKVCERWHDYSLFLADMGRKPSPQHSLDRYPDNDGNYEPGNCRWATASQQRSNQRRRIRWTTKLAAALLALGDIPYEDAKQMSELQLISLYQFDHGILHAFSPNDAFWNLTPRLISEHRKKSSEDKKKAAKAVRIRAREKEHKRVMAGGRKKASKWPSRPFPKREATR